MAGAQTPTGCREQPPHHNQPKGDAMNLRDALMSDAEAARRHRIWQATQDLIAAGFVEQPDGTWIPGDAGDSVTTQR